MRQFLINIILHTTIFCIGTQTKASVGDTFEMEFGEKDHFIDFNTPVLLDFMFMQVIHFIRYLPHIELIELEAGNISTDRNKCYRLNKYIIYHKNYLAGKKIIAEIFYNIHHYKFHKFNLLHYSLGGREITREISWEERIEISQRTIINQLKEDWAITSKYSLIILSLISHHFFCNKAELLK